MRRRGFVALAAACLAVGCAGVARGPLVPLASVASGIHEEMRYATPDNFLGVTADGYQAGRCLLTRDAAHALVLVQRDLAAEGLGLRVYDCYRPQRAVDHFARWAADQADQRTKPTYYPRVEKRWLFARGYIAARSGHSRGSTLDLTLVRASDGQALEMGTPFDLFDPLSHTDSPHVSAAARENRGRLQAAMARRGFRNLPEEWWHYTLTDEPFPGTYFDLPVK